MTLRGRCTPGVLFVLVCDGLLLACRGSSSPTPSPDASSSQLGPCTTWPCPTGWVSLRAGGCGPALLACAPDGAAAPGACDAGDATDASAWRRLPDGALRGPWPEDDDPDSGVPASDWAPGSVVASDFEPDTALTCPSGWQRMPNGLCDPRLVACPDGTYALPGARCTLTGGASCRSDASPETLAVPAGALVRWVQSGALATPDGSRERPFPSVADALRGAPHDAWLLLRDGSHAVAASVTRSVHLVGACAQRVTLTIAPGATGITVTGDATLDLRGVTLRGGAAAVAVQDAATLRATGVVVEGAASHGVVTSATATQVQLTDCAFVQVASGAPPEAAAVSALGRAAITRCHFERLGAPALRVAGAAAAASVEDVALIDVADQGITVSDRGHVALARTSIARARYAALSVADSTATTTDLAIADTTPFPNGITRGVAVGGRASWIGRGLSIANPTMSAVFLDAGATALLERVAIHGARMVRCRFAQGSIRSCSPRLEDYADDPQTALLGQNVSVLRGSSLTLRNASFRAGEGSAVYVVSSRATLEALRVEDYRAQRERQRGVHPGAVVAVESPDDVTPASATLRGSRITGCEANGVQVAGRLTTMLVEHTIVHRGHAPTWPGALSIGFGLAAAQGASLRVLRSQVIANEQMGAVALEGGAVELDACVIASTRAGPGVGNGSGLVAQGGTLTASDSVVAGNQRAGVAVLLGGRMRLARCVVRDTGPHPFDVAGSLPDGRVALVGVGAIVEGSGALELDHARLSANQGEALSAWGAGARVALDHAVLSDPRLPADGIARGVECSEGAVMTMHASRVEQAEQVGVHLVGDGTSARLTDSVVRSTRPGRADLAGFAINASVGARVELERAWLDDSARIAVSVHGAGSRAGLRDVFVTRVRSTTLPGRLANHGIGVHVGDGGAVTAERLALVDTGGAAVAVVSSAAAARADLHDVFVRGVRAAQIRSALPLGSAVSYGLHATGRATLSARHAAVEGAGWGFVRIGGALALDGAVVTRAPNGPGSSTGTADGEGLRLTGVCAPDNPSAAVAADQTLPAALVDSGATGCGLPPCN